MSACLHVSDGDFPNKVSECCMAGFEEDANDDRSVEIVHSDKRDRELDRPLCTVPTKFCLPHALTEWYLFSHKVKLTCPSEALGSRRPQYIWHLPSPRFFILPADAPKVNYKLPGFMTNSWSCSGSS
ncbi:hypothetical protein DFH09DRAFT_1326982 [Mycena vulgaris]|nr:hypothetical protein DFH09DRAFT_1326982 [Mycena vulgaris]